jgi:hypothetical protein
LSKKFFKQKFVDFVLTALKILRKLNLLSLSGTTEHLNLPESLSVNRKRKMQIRKSHRTVFFDANYLNFAEKQNLNKGKVNKYEYKELSLFSRNISFLYLLNVLLTILLFISSSSVLHGLNLKFHFLKHQEEKCL